MNLGGKKNRNLPIKIEVISRVFVRREGGEIIYEIPKKRSLVNSRAKIDDGSCAEI